MSHHSDILEPFDVGLLTLLQENSRATTTFLAHQLNSSRRHVSDRIYDLEKRGIIRFYPTIIDWAKAGFPVLAVIHVNVTPCKISQLLDKLLSLPDVASISVSRDQYNVHVMLRAHSTTALNAFIKKNLVDNNNIGGIILELILRHYFRGCEIETSLERRHFPIPLVRPRKPPKTVKLDSVDQMILKRLSRDARFAVKQLGHELSLAPNTISYRINKMVKNNIIRLFTVDIDYTKLGLIYTQIHLKIQPNKIGKMTDRLAPLSEVLWIDHITGPYNFMVHIVTHGRTHLGDFISSNLNQCSWVNEIKTSIVTTDHVKYYI
ncbi:MAG: Lrp/AsnC family transcriptional regulator [Candidatus Ranarchaeia archaeon]